MKRKRKGQFNYINEILYEWFKKSCAANIYPDGPMLKEEAMEIKKCLDKVEFKNFTTSNGWLEKWKISYGVREIKINGEAGELAEYTVSALMERLVEITRDYELADIRNMDETGCFLRHCQRKILLKRKVKPEERSCSKGFSNSTQKHIKLTLTGYSIIGNGRGKKFSEQFMVQKII